MKRFKHLAISLAFAASIAALFALSGCAQQQSYTPPQADPVINTPTISEDGVLKVGVDTSNAPLAGKSSSSGNIVGVDVDVASALADELGLKVQFVDVANDAAGALEAGTVDIVMGVNKASADGSFWVSEQYIDSSVVLFATSSSATVPNASTTSSIAAQASSTSSWAVTNEFEHANLETQTDLKSCFDLLKQGGVDYVAADAVKGLYTASRNNVSVEIIASMQSVSGYGVGVLDSNSTLKQAVSTALSAIASNGVMDVIESKWFGTTLDLSNTVLTEGAKSTVDSSTSSSVSTATGEASASDEASTSETSEEASATEETDGSEGSENTSDAQSESEAAGTESSITSTGATGTAAAA